MEWCFYYQLFIIITNIIYYLTAFLPVVLTFINADFQPVIIYCLLFIIYLLFYLLF